MIPACERLEADEATFGEAHIGLEGEFEFLPLNRLPEIGFHAEHVARDAVRARLVDGDAAAPARLRGVQREIGVADQVFGIAA